MFAVLQIYRPSYGYAYAQPMMYQPTQAYQYPQQTMGTMPRGFQPATSMQQPAMPRGFQPSQARMVQPSQMAAPQLQMPRGFQGKPGFQAPYRTGYTMISSQVACLSVMNHQILTHQTSRRTPPPMAAVPMRAVSPRPMARPVMYGSAGPVARPVMYGSAGPMARPVMYGSAGTIV